MSSSVLAITLIVVLIVGAVVFVVLSSRSGRAAKEFRVPRGPRAGQWSRELTDDAETGLAPGFRPRFTPRYPTNEDQWADNFPSGFDAGVTGPDVNRETEEIAPPTSLAEHPLRPNTPGQVVRPGRSEPAGDPDLAPSGPPIPGSSGLIAASHGRAGPASLPPLESYEPRQLGVYRILGRLGQGGYGNVYLGVDPAGRKVAIKTIRAEFAAAGDYRERFRREALAASRVARHSTAEILDFDGQGPLPYLVTEYIEGPTLSAWVRGNGPLHGSTLEQLAVAVASALAAIHQAGIIHRDLKPQNVLMSHTGPRVVDFGIARATDASEVFSRGTTTVGTPGFMAPEQFRGQPPASPKTDIFAWGALVAFAGTGAPPFGGGDIATIMYRTLDAEPVLEGLDAALSHLVRRALAKDPAARPDVSMVLEHLNKRRG